MCLLAPTPTLHISLLEFIILGAFAVGGVELVTTVLDTVFVSAKVWFMEKPISIKLNNKQLRINIYDTPLGKRWIEALKDNLKNKRILEKNFCWLGWADSNRNLKYLVEELNNAIDQINSFKFDLNSYSTNISSLIIVYIF